MPAATPVTIPEVETAVASAVLLLLHRPPGTVLLNVIELPAQTIAGPEIDEGGGTTVTIRVMKDPVGNRYVIRLVPIANPVTMPVLERIAAIAVEPELQVPPPGLPLNVVV
jgi:hypothetical protein